MPDEGAQVPDATRDVNSPEAIASMVTLGVIGGMGTFTFLPMIVGTAVDDLGFTPQQAGLLASAEMAGAGLGTFVVSPRVHLWNRRKIASLGLLSIIVGATLSMLAGSYGLLIPSRALTGLGAGAIVAAVIASMSGARNPERMFGLWTIFNMVMASTLFFVVMPRVIAFWGADGVFGALGVAALIGTFALRKYPVNVAAKTDEAAVGVIDKRKVGLGLVAIFCAYLAHGAIWAFMGRIGLAANLDAGLISRVLGSAALAGLAGGLLVTWLGTRSGRVLPNLAALVVSIASLLFVINGSTTRAFIVAAMLFYIAWVFGLPYLMGVIAGLDPGGRAAAFAIVMQNIGLAAGPALAGFMISGESFGILGWMGVVLYGVCLALILPLAGFLDRRERLAPA